jgi:hypothetical protein
MAAQKSGVEDTPEAPERMMSGVRGPQWNWQGNLRCQSRSGQALVAVPKLGGLKTTPVLEDMGKSMAIAFCHSRSVAC